MITSLNQLYQCSQGTADHGQLVHNKNFVAKYIKHNMYVEMCLKWHEL